MKMTFNPETKTVAIENVILVHDGRKRYCEQCGKPFDPSENRRKAVLCDRCVEKQHRKP